MKKQTLILLVQIKVIISLRWYVAEPRPFEALTPNCTHCEVNACVIRNVYCAYITTFRLSAYFSRPYKFMFYLCKQSNNSPGGFKSSTNQRYFVFVVTLLLQSECILRNSIPQA